MTDARTALENRNEILRLAQEYDFEPPLIAGPAASGQWAPLLTLIVTPTDANRDPWGSIANLRTAIEALTGVPVDLIWSSSQLALRLASSARPL